jgi:hypothetical protein
MRDGRLAGRPDLMGLPLRGDRALSTQGQPLPLALERSLKAQIGQLLPA